MPPKVIGPKRALSIELLLFFAYCFFSASWMVGSIVTTDMAQEFGVYTIPSSVNNAISAAKILGNFVAAWILLKLGPKRTVSLSCLLICAVVAAIIALAVVGGLKSQLKQAVQQSAAAGYIREGSFRLDVNFDHFLYESTTRRKIEEDTQKK